jgi:hypothetical protein
MRKTRHKAEETAYIQVLTPIEDSPKVMFRAHTIHKKDAGPVKFLQSSLYQCDDGPCQSRTDRPYHHTDTIKNLYRATNAKMATNFQRAYDTFTIQDAN